MGKIRNILKEITDPLSGYSILEVGIVEKIMIKGKDVIVRVNLPQSAHAISDYIVGEIRTRLIAMPYINNVIIEVSRHVLRYPFF